jgi:hypothetical protein
MKLTLASKAGKLPVVDATRDQLLNHVLPTLLDPERRQEFYQGKGENLTLGQDTFNIELTNDDDSPAGRLMFSWSVNLWGPKVAKDKASKAVEQDGYKLAANDVAALDYAIAKMKENADIDNAVKLATIKSTYNRVGTVTRDELKLIMGLQ